MKQIVKEFEKKLVGALTKKDLEEIFREYFSKKGKIKELYQYLKEASFDKKKYVALEIQEIEKKTKRLFEKKEAEILAKAQEEDLEKEQEKLGFEVPKVGHFHPITQTINELNDFFIKMGFSVHDGPELEQDEYCFQRLNVPKGHPARDMQDTLYVKEPDYLLRTQTSSIEARILETYKPPYKVVCPGRAYRNEKVNPSNHFVLHQYQGVVVLDKVSLKDLFGTFTALFKKMYGDDVVVRYRNKYYPEVEPGVGPDMQCFNCKGKGCRICKGVGWIEMGGAGIIHPNVMKMAGLDSKKWMGFAFGLGLDRWVMSKYKITDIRTLFSGNLGYKPNENENTL
jgi:phenylalanyl-tRNA synthetase alpha chain